MPTQTDLVAIANAVLWAHQELAKHDETDYQYRIEIELDMLRFIDEDLTDEDLVEVGQTRDAARHGHDLLIRLLKAKFEPTC